MGPAERRPGRRSEKRAAAAKGLVGRIEMTSDFDRREAEALRIEIWGLARRYGIRLKTLRVESAEP